ncbi:tftc-5 [Pristionchus pacificus]|nr:tftc-5 [Pristionchus pacificus]
MLRSLLPGPPKQEPIELVMISYPGIIKNVDKALETLGGLNSITQAYFNNRPLELRHTPMNPYTSCLAAERKMEGKLTSGTLHMAIRVKRKKKDPSVVKAECIGLVGTQFKFDSLCDFQYLPIRGKPQSDVFDDLIPRLIPTDLPSALCWWDKPELNGEETPLFLPPFQFSRYNTPSNKILCRETVFGEKTRKKALGHGHNLRVERKALSVNVHANDDFPLAPTADALADANFRCKNEGPHRMLFELFEERPLWTRVAVAYRTKLEETLLKSLLQKYAFYINNGPWGRLWCKFGYDPRKDPNSVLYQTLMVSFRQHTKIPERQRLKVSTSERKLGDEGEGTNSVNYVYCPGKSTSEGPSDVVLTM